MPRRTDIRSILIIGAGPIIIGQACEFDYSGTQACKALKELGYRVILVNSNPATIMTDPELADATYVEPVIPSIVAKIIEKERPDALLPTMGGQTALNVSKALAEEGVLERFGCELIGARLEAINKAEDRELFRKAMMKLGLEMPANKVVRNFDEAKAFLNDIGLPAIIRPSFTLGGTGGGIAYNVEEFEQIVKGGLEASPVGEVLIDESILGWKEFEMEVVRDKADNAIIVCSIENVDPMGVHTGDSITVAPALTLTDKEYQKMRTASIEVLREIGVDTGGSNVQWAVNPENGRMVIIEMNPRVSRSSALASKATGFPIAKVAAKLAVGFTLDEIMNDITGVTPASFEPSIDYIVTKIPRFAFEKFPECEPLLTTSMKSVGEAMAIGRSFKESLQKALRSLETGLIGLDDIIHGSPDQKNELVLAGLRQATPTRLLYVAQAFRLDMSVDEVWSITHIDPWFLRQVWEIVDQEQRLKSLDDLKGDPDLLFRLKADGFGDRRIAELCGTETETIRELRWQHKVLPVFKSIDTCAGEFASRTPYLYSSYERGAYGSDNGECEARPSNRQKVMILGGGPNRIGQGIEFDYCCVHAVMGLKDAGYETIMVNCNPETVSTDPDTSDRLYFEPLTAETVIEIAKREQDAGTLHGIIVQLGGQTPLRIAHDLEKAGLKIIGTPVDSIDLSEDRRRFQKLLGELNLKQPVNAICDSADEAIETASSLGLPLIVRPSYVLGGRAMRIVRSMDEIEQFVGEAAKASEHGAILLDQFLEDAIEIDVDVLADGENAHIAGVMEHIEEAGIHSGDSACVLPPVTLEPAKIDEVKAIAIRLALALGVRGLMNLQLAIKDDVIYILEVNPRASRTVPFVAKATGVPIAKYAARIMAGANMDQFDLASKNTGQLAVKEAVLPFDRFPGVDLLLGPEMKSTGEVMGFDSDFGKAFAKAQLAAGQRLPRSGTIFISVRDCDKEVAAELAKKLTGLGFEIVATRGTAAYLSQLKVSCKIVAKVHEGRPHIVDLIKNGSISLVFNTVQGEQSIKDSFSLRREALMNRLPYYTTLAGARAAVEALERIVAGELEVGPLQNYLDVSNKVELDAMRTSQG